jgi:fructose-1,6-bisphosphatase
MGKRRGEAMGSRKQKHIMLDRFLVQHQKNRLEASGELIRVKVQLGVVAKIISSYVGRSSLEGLKGLTGRTNVQGEVVKKLDKIGNDVFIEAFDCVGIVGALVSEEMRSPCFYIRIKIWENTWS